MNSMRWVVALTLTLWLTGCATSGLNQVDAANAERARWQAAAEAGDASAQYALANSYCCGEGFFDTALAIQWWCKAAAQSHRGALAALETRASGLASCTRLADDT
ncbi:MAG: hypothetical protein AAAFM81_13935 [Pseudomonadota bacterium]